MWERQLRVYVAPAAAPPLSDAVVVHSGGAARADGIDVVIRCGVVEVLYGWRFLGGHYTPLVETPFTLQVTEPPCLSVLRAACAPVIVRSDCVLRLSCSWSGLSHSVHCDGGCNSLRLRVGQVISRVMGAIGAAAEAGQPCTAFVAHGPRRPAAQTDLSPLGIALEFSRGAEEVRCLACSCGRHTRGRRGIISQRAMWLCFGPRCMYGGSLRRPE